MTDMVEECRIKFKEVLNSINSESKVTDDTFLEKITKYLKDGKYHHYHCYLDLEFHNVACNFFSPLSRIQ